MSNEYFVTREKCPACGSLKTPTTLYQCGYDESPVKDFTEYFYTVSNMVEPEYLVGASYHLVECVDCRLMYQNEIPGDFLSFRLYEYWIDPKGSLMHHHQDLDYRLRLSSEIATLIAYFDKPPASLKFFDFGLGWSRWSLMAKGFGVESSGSELSEVRLEYARKNGVRVLTWEEIPGSDFDFINTEQVFEHLPEPLETLKHLKTGLKPGGLVKISVPHANDIERRLKIMNWWAAKGSKDSLNPISPLEHINFFRRDSLLAMAREAGLTEENIPIRLQIQHASDWTGIKQVAVNFARPIADRYRHYRNYIFFRKPDR